MQILPTGQKEAAISPKNNDKKTLSIRCNSQTKPKNGKNLQKISLIKLFMNQYEYKGIIFYQNEKTRKYLKK